MNKVAKSRQRRVRRVWIRQLLLMLSVIGPGLITANVDNDATGITGYSLAGANYGYGLLWAIVLVTVSLFRFRSRLSLSGCWWFAAATATSNAYCSGCA